MKANEGPLDITELGGVNGILQSKVCLKFANIFIYYSLLDFIARNVREKDLSLITQIIIKKFISIPRFFLIYRS